MNQLLLLFVSLLATVLSICLLRERRIRLALQALLQRVLQYRKGQP